MINRNAPVEMFLGLVVSAVVGYSAIRLSLCLVRNHRVTPSLALSTAFRLVAFVYLVRWASDPCIMNFSTVMIIGSVIYHVNVVVLPVIGKVGLTLQ